MAHDIIQIQDAGGNVFYPQTRAEAVARVDGQSVEQALSALEAPQRQMLPFTYQNGWQDYTKDNSLEIWKDPWGYVHLAGAITGGNDAGVLTLPQGWRPRRTYAQMARNASNGAMTAYYYIGANGEMRLVDEALSGVYNISGYFYAG